MPYVLSVGRTIESARRAFEFGVLQAQHPDQIGQPCAYVAQNADGLMVACAVGSELVRQGLDHNIVQGGVSELREQGVAMSDPAEDKLTAIQSAHDSSIGGYLGDPKREFGGVRFIAAVALQAVLFSREERGWFWDLTDQERDDMRFHLSGDVDLILERL